MGDNVRKRMYTCMCGWVTLLYSRKLREHCKPAIIEKVKIIKLQKKRKKLSKIKYEWKTKRKKNKEGTKVLFQKEP